MDSVSRGLNCTAASPTTSGIELVLLHATGQPRFIASNGGIPKPSYNDGYTKIDASLYNRERTYRPQPDG